jgi:glutathione synthase
VGDKLVEVNVESPGGLQSVEHFTGIDFAPAIVEALVERASK